MTVLIVDDAGIMRMVLKDILIKSTGLRAEDIHESPNGLDGIAKYKSLHPDLVFLDISMPDIDGIATLKEIMKIDPSAKIIMCAASNDETDILECVKFGARYYIEKPPRPEKVTQAYTKLLLISLKTKNLY